MDYYLIYFLLPTLSIITIITFVVFLKVYLNNKNLAKSKIFSEIDSFLTLEKTEKSSAIKSFHHRADALTYIINDIKNETRVLDIFGTSLKGLFGGGINISEFKNMFVEFNAVIEVLLKKGVHIRILLTSPEFVFARAEKEGRATGEIEKEILDNLKYLLDVKQRFSNYPGRMDIRIYKGMPTIFALFTSTKMLVNPYPNYSEAYRSPCFVMDREFSEFSLYHAYHFELSWHCSIDVTSNINPYIEELTFYIKDNFINKEIYKVLTDKLKEFIK